MLLSIIIVFYSWTVHRFYLKIFFPDFNVAKKFSSDCTKIENIITSDLVQYSVDAVLKSFEKHNIAIVCFGVATDGSNHNELKLLPIIIQYFDKEERWFTIKIDQVYEQSKRDC